MKLRLARLVPATWSVAALVLVAHPGDEYFLLWAGTMPFAFVAAAIDSVASFTFALVLAVVGLWLAGRALDRLRADWRWWVASSSVLAVVLAVVALGEQASLAAAVRQQGSLLGWFAAAGALAVTVSTALMLAACALLRGLRAAGPGTRQET